jgi:predicted O-methyltransferase YrrM
MLIYAKHLLKAVSEGKPSALKALGYYSQWRKFQGDAHSSMHDRLPWITFAAIDYLKHAIKKDALVFEYGGGGSTLFFVDNAGKVITVEHNPEWFGRLQESLQEAAGQKRWEGHLIPAVPMAENGKKDPANPGDYYSDDEAYAGHSFKDYVTFIDRFPDHHFDVVLVDGRARTSCIKHAAPKVKPGGLLVLDNADRRYYLQQNEHSLAGFRLVVNAWGPIPFNQFFSQTNVWIKAN